MATGECLQNVTPALLIRACSDFLKIVTLSLVEKIHLILPMKPCIGYARWARLIY